MHLSLLSTLPLIVLTALAETQTWRPAIKDSTILRSTTSCAECPERNCYKCTLGHNATLLANTGGLAYVRWLVAFEMPIDPNTVNRCTVQFPGLVRLMPAAVNVTVAEAVSSAWDEATVTGENAPEAGTPFTNVQLPAYSNLGPLDVTQACKKVGAGEVFSVYIGTVIGSVEVWSKDSGSAAILHVFH